ncbi:hypothetical protein QBC44DRAFT_389895 [Cladorrhinum sp. PSN332]|nr:hypothetical protein QBC44DRAFT_389895 [Cladorrhinum sp. PSN332]
MQVCYPVFSRLAVAFGMPPAFSELLPTFGYKTADADGLFQLCFSYFQEVSFCAAPPSLKDQLGEYHICYNIRYVELNGCGGKNPWSFRNFGVLHSLRPSSSGGDSSCWLLISIPPEVRARLKQQVNRDDNQRQLLWHAYLLGAMQHNWRFYINFLAEQYREISTSVLVSSFSIKNKTGLTSDLTTSESLRAVHTQAHKALCILRSYGNVSQGVIAHARGLRQLKLIRQDDARAVISSGASTPDGDHGGTHLPAGGAIEILRIHGPGGIIGTVQDKLRNLERNLADSKVQQQSLVSLSRRLSQDSGVTRAVTVVSLAYASAGLVAALFESNLIETSSPVSAFTVNKDMWIFVLAALSFTFLTVLGVWALEASQKRKVRGIQ